MKRETIVVNLTDEAVKFLKDVRKLSGVSKSDIVNVILAIDIVRSKANASIRSSYNPKADEKGS